MVVNPHLPSNLHHAITEVGKKAGVAFDSVYLPEKGKGRWMVDLHNNGQQNELIIGQTALKQWGYSKQHDVVSDPLKAILFHEAAHLHYPDHRDKLIARFSPFAGAAVGLLAVNLIERYQRRQEARKQSEATASEDNPEAALGKNPKGNEIQRAAKYIAGAVIGASAGLAVTALLNNRMEYRADKFAAEMMDSPQPMIDALKSYVPNLRKYEHKKHLSAKDTLSLSPSMLRKYDKVMERLYSAPLQNRIDRLEAMKGPQR
jgi:Zn-dependent protease with chaperone function